MNCTAVRERLDDLVDEEIGERERGPIDDHLDACNGCRRELRDLREIVAAAAGLPRALEPERDPWPRIASAIGNRTEAAGASPRAWFAWLSPPRLAAAALAVAALAVAFPILRTLRQPPPAGDGGVLPASLGVAPNDYRLAEAELRAATALLQESLERRRPMLRPETIAVVEENLRVIDDAIVAVGAALESDPGDRRLGGALTAMYRRKVDVLLKAAALPADI